MKNTATFQLTPELSERLDHYRRTRPEGIPSRAGAIVALLDYALHHHGHSSTGHGHSSTGTSTQQESAPSK